MAYTVTAISLSESSSTPPCLLGLRAILQSLPVHHLRVAHFAMLNPVDFLQLDARQIGYQCGTSEATVVRFASAPVTGLNEMKKTRARTCHGGHPRTANKR